MNPFYIVVVPGGLLIASVLFVFLAKPFRQQRRRSREERGAGGDTGGYLATGHDNGVVVDHGGSGAGNSIGGAHQGGSGFGSSDSTGYGGGDSGGDGGGDGGGD